jgi:hypothetical protein
MAVDTLGYDPTTIGPAGPSDGLFTFVVGDGVNVVPTGFHGLLIATYACEITDWYIANPDTGSIVFDIWKIAWGANPPTVANTITAAAKPTLSGAKTATSGTLTGWTTTVAAADIIGINVDSSATVKRVTLALKVER